MTAPNGAASAGAVVLEVEPDAKDFYTKLRAQVMPAAEQLGREIGQKVGAPLASQVSTSLRTGVRTGGREAAGEATKVGNDIGRDIAAGVKGRLEEALSHLPEIDLKADSSKLEKKIVNVRRQLEELSGKTVGVDIASDEFEAKANAVKAQLATLARDIEKVRESGGKIPIGLDAIAAGVQLQRLKADLVELHAEAAKPVEVELKSNAGAFATKLKASIEAAVAALPDIDIRANSSDAELKLVELKARLEELHGKTIGVDITADEAVAKLTALQAELRELAATSPNVQVRVDAAGAAAKLDAVIAASKVVAAQSPTVTVDADTGGAIASLFAMVGAETAARIGLISLASAGGLLATAIVPAAAAAVFAIAAFAPAALAGVAAIGVLGLGFSGVFGAYQKLSAAQDSSTKSASANASSQNAVANAVQSLSSAEASLANTKANAADAEVRAAEQVRQSEKAYTQAVNDARKAEEALTQARLDAANTMADLNNQVADGALSQRAAVLDLADAQVNLNKTLANPASSGEQKARAQLQYDQAKQQIADLGQRQKEVVEKQQDAQKKGIDGSTQVVSAQNAIAQAQDKVAQAAQAVTDAQRQQASTIRQNQFSIQQATNAVASAQRGLQQAYETAGAAGQSAADKTKAALAGLSPAGVEFVKFLLSIKGQLSGLKGAAEGGLLPGVEAGIKGLLPLLPVLTPLVGQIAGALGDLFAKGGKALGSPFWVQFFTMIAQLAIPLIRTAAPIIGGFAKGFAGIVEAFLPYAVPLAEGIAKIAGAFAGWATSLAGSDGFKKFVAYAIANGPQLLSLIANLAVVAVKLVIAIAPLGALMLQAVAALAAFLAKLSPGQLIAIAAAIGLIVATIAIAVSGPLLAIVIGIGLVVAAIVYCWTHFKTFRDVVLGTWLAIKIAALFLWNNVLKPTFDFIAAAVLVIADVLTWWWHHVIVPVFDAIGAVISWWWKNIGKPIFDLIVVIIRDVVAPIFMFLWHNVIEPVWAGIQIAISIAWAIIQVIFGLIKIELKILGAVFEGLWKYFIKPTWDLIWTAIKFVWDTVLHPVFTAFGDIIEKYVAPAFKRGVDAISKAWSVIQDVAKIPIKFIIDTVLNDGLLAAYNFIAKTFSVKPDNVHIDLPKGFAGGGYIVGPGGPTDDAILARLSNGEYVIPAEIVRRYGISFFDQIVGRDGVQGGSGPAGDGSEGLLLPGFAGGGFVGHLENAWNKITDPIGYIRDEVAKLLGQIPGGDTIKGIVSGLANKGINGLLDWVGAKITNQVTTGVGSQLYTGPITPDVVNVQNWIKAQAGKPYRWAEAGPGGYDCSGMQSAAWNMLHGKPIYNHTFSTANESQYFPLPGHGLFTVGFAGPNEKGGGRVGHTAGNLAGLPFVSRGGDGVVVGDHVESVDSFARVGHYDQGGYLMPGITIARNDTGVPEPVLTGSQWQAIRAGQQGGGSGDTYHYSVYPQQATLDAAGLKGITDAAETRARLRRPR